MLEILKCFGIALGVFIAVVLLITLIIISKGAVFIVVSMGMITWIVYECRKAGILKAKKK